MAEPTSEPLAALSRALEAAVTEAAARVVRIDDNGRSLSGLLWADGTIITAEECLGNEERVSVTLADGRALSAEIAGRDPSTDVALLRADTGPVTAWPAALSPAVGALALAVGRGADGPLAAFGIVAEVGEAWTSVAGGRIDARIRLGFALPHRIEGGAAITAEGRLLGMVVSDPRRRALVIPAATVGRAVDTLADKGYVGRGYLGLTLQPMRHGPAKGLIVAEVAEGGPAAAAGFLIGDIVTTWDGAPIAAMRELSRHLGVDAVGQSVRIGVLRAGAPAEISMTVGERRPG